MELNYIDIGKRIRNLRKKQGISQEKLAELTDLSIVHISHIETGNTKLSLPALVNIANALSVTADMLLCGNLDNSAQNFKAEIADTLKDCSNVELRVIADMAYALKQSLRKWNQ
jgi:transcriptional regulator with XRE-family HTH domain